MAGSIPPLVSSTPPPLCAFDDDEEEDEDEFAMYAAAEDIDYNECISFKEKNEEKQSGGKVRGEQDSTSQDSATDSGLCPDSEGMSPIPPSDEERTVRQSANSACDKLCQEPSDLPTLKSGTEGFDSSSVFSALPDLPNGHVTAEDPEDDFGNFEYTPAKFTEQVSPSEEEPGINLIKPPEKEENISLDLKTEEVLEGKDSNRIFESLPDQDEEFDEHKEIATSNTICTAIESKNVSPSVFTALEPPDTSDNFEIHDQQQASLEEHTIINANTILKTEQNTEINLDDDKFDQNDDGFSDFKADFSNFDSPYTEQCDNVSEHSKPIFEQKHSEEPAKSACVPPNDASDDEFSDFTEFSSSDCAFVSAQRSISVENVSHIPIIPSDDSDLRTDSEFQDWVSVFPSSSSDPPSEDGGGQTVMLSENDPVWSRLIPLESSPALSYLWAESLANRHLLAALNIDSRNILMMPWMPRFAANLSCGPLQPVKAPEPLQPTPAPAAVPVQPSSSKVHRIESVPDAHFDWVGSGLTNPLDYPKPVLKLKKALSAETETILSLLPDLSFMRKTYIDFPVNEG